MTTHYRKNQQENMLAKLICAAADYARIESFGNEHMEGVRD